jgi:hypothetical protein
VGEIAKFPLSIRVKDFADTCLHDRCRFLWGKYDNNGFYVNVSTPSDADATAGLAMSLSLSGRTSLDENPSCEVQSTCLPHKLSLCNHRPSRKELRLPTGYDGVKLVGIVIRA